LQVSAAAYTCIHIPITHDNTCIAHTHNHRNKHTHARTHTHTHTTPVLRAASAVLGEQAGKACTDHTIFKRELI